MTSTAATNQRVRGLFGTGLASWLLINIAMFAPEWTRQGDKHCGVIFCCLSLYGNCTITDTAVVGDKFSYIFASWFLSFVAICSASCRCSNVKVENVRQMAVLLVISGVMALTGTAEFFIHKFTNDELDFSAGGFIAHGAGWMLFISGCCGFCFGYDYEEESSFGNNSVFPFDIGGRDGFGASAFGRFDPLSFARKKWREMQSMRSMPPSISEVMTA